MANDPAPGWENVPTYHFTDEVDDATFRAFHVAEDSLLDAGVEPTPGRVQEVLEQWGLSITIACIDGEYQIDQPETEEKSTEQ